MKHFTLLIFFLLVCSIKLVFAQTSITVGMGPTAQNVNLGLYGDKRITQITLVCMTSSSNYKWAIDAPWKTTTGKTGTFTTTTNTITIVPLPGYSGCAGGTVGVSSGGAPELLKADGNPPVSNATAGTQATFSYIVGLNHSTPSISISFLGRSPDNNVAYLGSSVANVYSSGVSYTEWSMAGSSHPNLLYFFKKTANQPGVIYVMPSGSYLTTYTTTVKTTVNVAGSVGCNVPLSRYLTVRPRVAPTPAQPATCYTMSLEEIACNTFLDSISGGPKSKSAMVSPNPATGSFQVDLDGGVANNISLYTHDGVLIETKRNVSDQITWDASSLQKGIYIIKIVDGDRSTTKRLVIK